MAISQISVFAESKPGHLNRLLEVFRSSDVSVRGYSLSDTGEFGIVRFIVDKPEVALDALKRHGCACTLAQVLCIKLEDKPGELARVTSVLAHCNINVTYSYSMISTYIIISTPDVAHAETLLANEPIEMVDQDGIFRIGTAFDKE